MNEAYELMQSCLLGALFVLVLQMTLPSYIFNLMAILFSFPVLLLVLWSLELRAPWTAILVAAWTMMAIILLFLIGKEDLFIILLVVANCMKLFVRSF